MLDFLADDLQPAHALPFKPPPKKKAINDIIHPYPNISSFLFNRWHWNIGKKTKTARADFIISVTKLPDFNLEDMIDVNFDDLDTKLAENPGGVVEDNGWTESSVPTGKKEIMSSRQEAARRRQAHVDNKDSDDDGQPYATGRKYLVSRGEKVILGSAEVAHSQLPTSLLVKVRKSKAWVWSSTTILPPPALFGMGQMHIFWIFDHRRCPSYLCPR